MGMDLIWHSLYQMKLNQITAKFMIGYSVYLGNGKGFEILTSATLVKRFIIVLKDIILAKLS